MLVKLISMIFPLSKPKRIADISLQKKALGIPSLAKGWEWVILCGTCSQVTCILASAKPAPEELDKYSWTIAEGVGKKCTFCSNNLLKRREAENDTLLVGGVIVSARPLGWRLFRRFRKKTWWELRSFEIYSIDEGYDE